MRLASVPFSNFRFFFLRATVNVLGHSEAASGKSGLIRHSAETSLLCHVTHIDRYRRHGSAARIRVGLHATKFQASAQRNSIHV
jgi:hypothetical protein